MTLTAEQARLFREPNFGTVATIGPDGAAQLSVVWVDTDGEDVLFKTDRLARKYTGRESFGVKDGERRLVVRVRPERVESYGLD